MVLREGKGGGGREAEYYAQPELLLGKQHPSAILFLPLQTNKSADKNKCIHSALGPGPVHTFTWGSGGKHIILLPPPPPWAPSPGLACLAWPLGWKLMETEEGQQGSER